MLRRAHREYGDEIAFVGVDIRDDEGDALEFVAEHDLDFWHVRDEDLSIYDDYGLTGQPETFFLDSDGTIVEHVNGPLFEDDLVALLEDLSNERSHGRSRTTEMSDRLGDRGHCPKAGLAIATLPGSEGLGTRPEAEGQRR